MASKRCTYNSSVLCDDCQTCDEPKAKVIVKKEIKPPKEKTK
jgi:hypothetical protein